MDKNKITKEITELYKEIIFLKDTACKCDDYETKQEILKEKDNLFKKREFLRKMQELGKGEKYGFEGKTRK